MEILGKNIGKGPLIIASAVAVAGLTGYLLKRDSSEQPGGKKTSLTAARELTDQERLDIVMKAVSWAADQCAIVMKNGEAAPLSDGEAAKNILITDAEPNKPESISMQAEDCAVLAPAAENSPFLKPGRDGSVEFTPTKVAGFTYTDYLDGDVRQRVAAVITWMQTRNPKDSEARDGRSSTVNVHLSARVKPETTFSFNFSEFVSEGAECGNPDKPGVPAPPFPLMFGDFSCYPPVERRRKEKERAKEIAAWEKAMVGYRLQTEKMVWGQLIVGEGRGAKRRQLQFGAEAMVKTMGAVHGRVKGIVDLYGSRRRKR